MSDLRHATTQRTSASLVWEAFERNASGRRLSEAVVAYGPGGESEVWTHERVFGAACAIASAVAARTEPGDRVLLDGADASGHTHGPLQIAATLGCVRAGVWVLPVPMQTTAHECETLRERIRPSLVLGRQGQDSAEYLGLDALALKGASGLADPVDEGGVILATSGSTGEKKLVMRSAAALDADGLGIVNATGLTESDRALLAISLSHSYAIDMMMGAVLAGACIETVPVFDVSVVAARLAEGATVFPGVPFLFEGLVPRWRDRGQTRLVFSAGSRMPAMTREAFTQASGLAIGDLYGSSELGTVLFREPTHEPPTDGLMGLPLPGVEVRVLDTASGQALGVDEEGELVIRAPSMLCGYVDETLELVDGFFRTGDLAKLAADGSVTLTGRVKEIIEAGGVKFNPLEVEREVERHPAVRECLVQPVRASATITRLRALIVLEPGAREPSEAELRAHLRGRVGSAKIPRRFECVESLPRTRTGKPLRTAEEKGTS